MKTEKLITSVIFCLLFVLSTSTHAQNSEPQYCKVTDYRDDSTRYTIIPIPFEELEYQRITAKDNSSWGYINRADEIVIPLGKYKFLNPIDEQGMILAHKDGKKGFIDITEKILIPFIYDDVGVFSKSVDLAPVISNGKQGFVNRRGELVIPLEYDARSYVTYFYEPGAAILMKDGKYGVIGPKNNIIIPFEYNEIEWSDNKDSFIVTQGKDWASFSLDGRELSEFNDYIIITQTPLGSLPADSKDLPILVTTKENKKKLRSFYSNMDYQNGTKRFRDSIEASVAGEYAYIDKTKKMIVPFSMYDHAEPFGLGRKAIVARKGVYGIINEYGKMVLPLEYDFIERPSQYSHYADIFVASKGQRVTIFDKDVQVVPVDDIASYAHWDCGLFITDTSGKTGFLNYRGQQTIPFEYDTLYHSSTGKLIARKGNKYGCISKKNKVIHPFEYQYIYGLQYGLVLVNAKGKAGMYNKKGNRLILPFEYQAIHDTFYDTSEAKEAKYIVGKNGKVGTVDTRNKVVIPIIYDGLSGWVEYGPDAHFAKKDGKYGLVSYEGKVIIPTEYDYVGLPAEGIIIVRKNGKYGVRSWEHEEILPCIYDNIFDDIPYFDFGDEKEVSKLVVLQNGIWSYLDMKGGIIREDIPKDEIMKHYDYRLEWGEPSNERGFDMRGTKIVL